MKENTNIQQSGFSLLETIIAIGIFTVVAVISIGALVMIQHSSRQAQTTRVIVATLSQAMDDIVRTAQTGKSYVLDTNGYSDCSNVSGESLTVIDKLGKHTTFCKTISSPTSIIKTINGGAAQVLTQTDTSTGVSISRVVFSLPSGTIPRVAIVLNASIIKGRYKDTLNLYTTVTRRVTSL